MRRLPYWRLSGYYFFYFAFVGAMSPYWGLYLKSLTFSAWQIGVLMSLLQVMRIFSPNIWGWISDRTGHRSAIVQITAVLSVLSFLAVFWAHDFIWLFVVMAAVSFFWSASLPLVEATTLSHLRERTHHYGRIRLWGSIGFIAAVLMLGYWLDTHSISHLPWVVLALLLGIVALALWMPDAKPARQISSHINIWKVIRRPQVMTLLLACFLMAMAHGPYYTFYSIYLVQHGYSKGAVGGLWALGVFCEIAVFMWLPRWLPNVSMVKVLLATFAIAVIRFLMIARGIDHPVWIILAQTLHAATFGAHHLAAMALIHRYFHGRNQVRGQGIYNSVTYGVGGTAGGLFAGALWEVWGGERVFLIAAGCAVLALLLVLWQRKAMAVAG